MNVGIEDFLNKEHKTLNVNITVTDDVGASALNNKINFDSEKYARHGYQDNTRPSTTIENLKARDTSNGEKNGKTKRVKTCNIQVEESQVCLATKEGGDQLSKRMRLDSAEKNAVMEGERREVEMEVLDHQTEPPSCCSETARDPARLKEAIEADRYWEKYLNNNSTVMARTFQGQFKNTIICSSCSHVSVSFEPFMYLSVPLPRANEIQWKLPCYLPTLSPLFI